MTKIGKRTIADSRWSRYGVHAVHVSGRRGRLRYRLVFTDRSQSTAGPFDTPRDALRHAHAVAVLRSRLDHLRVPRVGSERWLWHAGDLEELAALPACVSVDPEVAEAELVLAAAEREASELGPDRITEKLGWEGIAEEARSRLRAQGRSTELDDALVLWTSLWSGGAVA